LRAAIAESFRSAPDGMPRGARGWLPSPGELERMHLVFEDNLGRLRRAGHEV